MAASSRICSVAPTTSKYIPADTRYAAPTPCQPMRNATAAGPMKRVPFIAIELSVMAFSIRSFPTNSGMIEVRTGWFIAMLTPSKAAKP